MSNGSNTAPQQSPLSGFWRPLVAGPAPYRLVANWPLWIGIGLTMAIFAASIGLSIGLVVALMGDDNATNTAGEAGAFGHSADVAALLVYQLATVVLVWVAAGHSAISRRRMLALRPWRRGTFLPASLVLFGVAATFLAISLLIAPHMVRADLTPFVASLQQPGWWLLALAIVVGAPLSEELLFRGFLLPVLAQTRLGFAGAALISNTAWTALHFGYSPVGLIDVFLAGLVFSWLVWRTGSLWTAIVLHGLYNAAILAGLMAYFGVGSGVAVPLPV